jgi:putative peptidoglycan lipid II flippase
VRPLDFGGLALANTVATSLEALLLLALLRRRMGGIDGRRLADSLLRTVVAAGAMGGALFLFNRWLWAASQAAVLWGGMAALLTGVGIFLGASALLRHPELQQVSDLAAQRLRRRAAG